MTPASLDSQHRILIKRATSWLFNTKKCFVVLTDFVSAVMETPDAIGWWHAGHTIVVECKASRSDFIADRKKPTRQNLFLGMGNNRYYLCEPNIILTTDNLNGWGLLHTIKNKIKVVVPSADFTEVNKQNETAMLLSLIRRDAQVTKSIRYYLVPSNARKTVAIIRQGTLL